MKKFMLIIVILLTFRASIAQQVSSTFGYNGSVFTTIELGYSVKGFIPTVYLAIPFWDTGDISYNGRLHTYSYLGYFTGARVLYDWGRITTGVGIQYEAYSYSVTMLTSYVSANDQDSFKDWSVGPTMTIEYQLLDFLYIGGTLSRYPDIHLRITTKPFKPKD